MSETQTIDLESLTIGELQKLEEATGQPFDELMGVLSTLSVNGQQKMPPVALLAGLAWIVQGRVTPGISLSDAADKTTLDELMSALGVDENPPVEGTEPFSTGSVPD